MKQKAIEYEKLVLCNFSELNRASETVLTNANQGHNASIVLKKEEASALSPQVYVSRVY